MECCSRPNRSDVHLSKEEAVKIEEATRDYFDGVAPKRHTKPQRSEYAKTYTDAISNGDDNGDEIPEFASFQRLENDSQKLEYKGGQVTEEFVETEYYKDLGCIDKEHHTTGTGFIKVGSMRGKSFSLAADDAVTECHPSCKGNPATNEWIPAPVDAANFISEKPSRSDI